MDTEQYIQIRGSVPIGEVSFGYRTVRLFPVDELEEGQLGYSVGDAGEDFTGEDAGDWQRSWLVIGYEDSHLRRLGLSRSPFKVSRGWARVDEDSYSI